jgi:hypothetical protein
VIRNALDSEAIIAVGIRGKVRPITLFGMLEKSVKALSVCDMRFSDVQSNLVIHLKREQARHGNKT